MAINHSNRNPKHVVAIGTGYQMLDSLLVAMIQLQGEGLITVVAVVDINTEAARRAAERFGIPSHYSSIAEMLAAEPTVGAAVVATPNRFHAENAIELIDAGVHVLVEKPLASTVRGGRDMVQAAEERGLVLCCDYQYPQQIRGARSPIEEGRLGEINLIEARWLRRDGIPQKHFWQDRRSGGVLVDLGVHLLSAVLYLVGTAPTLVSAIGHNQVGRGLHGDDFRGADSVSLTLGWPELRAQAQVHTSWAAAIGPEDIIGIDVWGSKGVLHVPMMGAGLDVDAYRPTLYEHRLVDAAEAEKRVLHVPTGGDKAFVTETTQLEPPIDTERCFAVNIAEFIRACLGEGELLFPAGLALDIARICSAGVHSAEHGGRQVDLENEDDPGAAVD